MRRQSSLLISFFLISAFQNRQRAVVFCAIYVRAIAIILPMPYIYKNKHSSIAFAAWGKRFFNGIQFFFPPLPHLFQLLPIRQRAGSFPFGSPQRRFLPKETGNRGTGHEDRDYRYEAHVFPPFIGIRCCCSALILSRRLIELSPSPARALSKVAPQGCSEKQTQ